MKLRAVPIKKRIQTSGIVAILVTLFLFATRFANLDIARFVSRFGNFRRVLPHFLQINTAMILPGLRELTISFAMGVLGLVIGGVFAFFLAFLAADNIAPFKPLGIFIKTLASLIRAIPSLVLLLVIVAAIGLGYRTGVMGLAFSSFGYLTKAFIATIEEQDGDIIIAMRATGANWGQIVVHGLMPAVITGFLAWIALRLETSIAESISLGVVGAGGIGALLARAIRQFDYGTISTLIIIIFTAMFALELAMNRVRKALR